jgi:hypothetical protein
MLLYFPSSNYQTKSELPSGHFKFKITGHFLGFYIDLIEFYRRKMPADYYAKRTYLAMIRKSV